MCFEGIKNDISNLVDGHRSFWEVCKKVYEYQKSNNPLYRRFLELLSLDVSEPSSFDEIPLIPISFFKNHKIRTGNWKEQTVFRSSGTTGQTPSSHYLRDLNWYHMTCKIGFEIHFDHVSEYCHLGLLPSYLERNDSSLVYMVDYFIKESKYAQSGFYLDEFKDLKQILTMNAKDRVPTVLWGVTFGLLDLAEAIGEQSMEDLIIIETGGMKGRRKEIIRSELHELLKRKFGVPRIYSEYGMTELSSQAYTKGGSYFHPAPTIRYILKDLNDPLSKAEFGRTGQIGCIDLANIDTCSFILTDDIGRMNHNVLNVLVTKDNSEIRGCNLIVESQ
jgi:hypothetical protein